MGYLVLTVPPSMYNIQHTLPFVVSVNVGSMLAMPDPSPTEIFISKIFRNHVEALQVWREYRDLYRAIMRVIKAIFPKVYFRTLWNRHTVYATVGSLDIFTHLHANYGTLEDEDIKAIDMEINTPINGDKHFKDFVAQIEDNQEYVTSQTPYTNEK